MDDHVERWLDNFRRRALVRLGYLGGWGLGLCGMYMEV